jgi:hypothetical protein
MAYTPVRCCGFECGQIGTGLHWQAGLGTASIVTSPVRSGARALRCNASGTGVNVSHNATAVVERIYVYFQTSLPSGDCSIFAKNDGHVRFKSSDSKLYCYDANAATFGASGVTVTTNTWYRIDVKIVAATSIDAQVDGVALGQKTANATAAGATIGVIASVTADILFDDHTCSNTAGDYPIGDGFVNHFVPISDGTHNVAGAADFKRGAAGIDITNSTTDSYLLVDDIPMDAVGAVPTTNDYINAIAPPAGTDYTENVFGPAPGVSTPTVAPRAVEVIVETAQASTATGSFKLNLNDNGTVDTIKEQVTIAGVVNVAAARKHYATAPTGGAWTVVSGAGNFNNLRIRFYSADAAPDQYFVAAMIEAEFAPVVGRTTKNTRAFPLGMEIGMNWVTPTEV